MRMGKDSRGKEKDTLCLDTGKWGMGEWRNRGGCGEWRQVGFGPVGSLILGE